MKDAVQIVDVPVGKDTVVYSHNRHPVRPVCLADTMDSDKYKVVCLEKYDQLIGVLSSKPGFDVVSFNLRSEGCLTEITRSFFDKSDGRPVLESTIVRASDGTTVSAELMARTDILAKYKNNVSPVIQSNVPCNEELAKELFFRQGANWRNVVEAAQGLDTNLMEMLLDATDRGLVNFINKSENWAELDKVYSLYADRTRPVTKDVAANAAVKRIFNHLFDTIASVVGRELLIDASCYGLDTLTNGTYVEDDMTKEDVWAVVASAGSNLEKAYIVFGAVDEKDAADMFYEEFELGAEHITPSSMKKITLIYSE